MSNRLAERKHTPTLAAATTGHKSARQWMATARLDAVAVKLSCVFATRFDSGYNRMPYFGGG